MNAKRLAYLTLATLCASAPVFCVYAARPMAATREVRVSYAGLDLSQPVGVKQLYGRIRMAGQSVCKDLFTLMLGERRREWEHCVQESMASAVAAVDSPALTEYFAARQQPSGPWMARATP